MSYYETEVLIKMINDSKITKILVPVGDIDDCVVKVTKENICKALSSHPGREWKVMVLDNILHINGCYLWK